MGGQHRCRREGIQDDLIYICKPTWNSIAYEKRFWADFEFKNCTFFFSVTTKKKKDSNYYCPRLFVSQTLSSVFYWADNSFIRVNRKTVRKMPIKISTIFINICSLNKNNWAVKLSTCVLFHFVFLYGEIHCDELLNIFAFLHKISNSSKKTPECFEHCVTFMKGSHTYSTNALAVFFFYILSEIW